MELGPRSRREARLFEELAVPMLDDLYRLACRFEREPQDAQDLLQEALLAGFRKFQHLRDASAFRAWMSSIVRNIHLNRRSGTTPQPPLDGLLEHAPLCEGMSETYEPERRLLARRLSHQLKKALDRLPEEQRVAVLLIDVQGFRYADAAQALGVAPGTVASRVARARAALRGFLKREACERGWAKS